MAAKSKWTDAYFSPVTVLNHSRALHLKKATNADLDELATCDDIGELELVSSPKGEVLDLAKLGHIRSLEKLQLEKVSFIHLDALKTLPKLRFLILDNVAFDCTLLDGWEQLETLFMYRCKLTAFPSGLKLPRLNHLLLRDQAITDLAFAASYPALRQLDVGYNPISDLRSLAACDWLEELHLGDTRIQSLAPIKGFKHLTRLDVPSTLTPEGNTLLQPEPENDPNEPGMLLSKQASQVTELIRQQQWQKVYAVTDLEVLATAFRWVFQDHMDEAMLHGMLDHPLPGAWQAAVIAGLDAHYVTTAKFTYDALKAMGERLIPALQAGFVQHLATPGHYWGFEVGKFKRAHFNMASLISELASPAYSEVFQAFFELREQFSAAHLILYKKLFDGVGKTTAVELVEPIIDVLRFEKQVIGGDAVLLKKALKAIGQLGNQTHIPLLEAGFDIRQEQRPDVQEAYTATLTRLQKKKA